MQITTYSTPDFDPYGDRDPEPSDAGGWAAPVATQPLDAHLSLPGSKSLTARELVLSALAVEPSRLIRPLHSRDSLLMIEALRALGTRIQPLAGDGEFGDDIQVIPRALYGGFVDCGLAGTVMRFVAPLAGLAQGPVAFDGDPHARTRPMRELLTALRGLGLDINDDGRGTLPFTVHGTGAIAGGELTVDASKSSQFVSALLLAAPRFRDGLDLRHEGEHLPSMPHIEMTIASLAARGVTVETPEVGRWVVASQPIAGRDVEIESDLSNAAPFLAAALVAGGRVRLSGWPASTTQVGALVPGLLERFGAAVTYDDGAVIVDGGAGVHGGREIPGLDLDLSAGGELAPTFAGLAALASGPSRIRGIGHLRGHETDRLSALATELTRLGASVTEHDDGLEITPGPLTGGPWGAYADHRMATTGALVGLAVPGVVVDDIATTGKTLPEFAELWQHRLLGTTAPGVSPL